VHVVPCHTEQKVVGEKEETGDVTWSLMAPRVSNDVNDDVDSSTTACVNDDDSQQPASSSSPSSAAAAAAAAAAAETETIDTTAAGDRFDVNR